jgi:hypothetical protein
VHTAVSFTVHSGKKWVTFNLFLLSLLSPYYYVTMLLTKNNHRRRMSVICESRNRLATNMCNDSEETKMHRPSTISGSHGDENEDGGHFHVRCRENLKSLQDGSSYCKDTDIYIKKNKNCSSGLWQWGISEIFIFDKNRRIFCFTSEHIFYTTRSYAARGVRIKTARFVRTCFNLMWNQYTPFRVLVTVITSSFRSAGP